MTTTRDAAPVPSARRTARPYAGAPPIHVRRVPQRTVTPTTLPGAADLL